MEPKNVIPDRIAETLRRFPPFSMLPEPEVRRLAVEATVRVLVAGDQVWKQGDRPSDELLFLARGRVEYFWEHEGATDLVDVRDVGDLLGLTALIEDQPFRVTARVVEDSLFYCFAWMPVKALLDAHDTARHYARRHLFWATRVGGDIAMPAGFEGERSRSLLQAHLDGAQRIRPRDPARLLTCGPDEPIRRAAALMAGMRLPSILVIDEQQRPLGIVTNSNLVKQVIVGGLDKQEPVSCIMSQPVVTVSAGSSTTAALLLMLRSRIGQVCVTEDGTTATRALDVCSEKDLLTQSGHHPAGLLRQIRQASSPARFRELCDEIETIARSYLEAGVSAIFLGQICAELYDELVGRLIALATDKLGSEGVVMPPIPWAWLSVGSDGRREQILRTDMDNGMIFAPSGSAEQDEINRAALVKLGAAVVEMMVACGFARCQGGVMAANPRWVRTGTEWRDELRALDDGRDGDRLLRAAILFDLRFVAGDRALCEEFRADMLAGVAANEPLLRRLAGLVVDTPPPLNFWGRFVVENRGGRESGFDIKNRALSPLRDAARVLALKHGLTRRYSTGGRWEDIRRTQPRSAEMAALARDGYDLLLRLRTLNGLRRGDTGRFIDIASLSKLERSQLSNAFDVLRMVQNSVRLEFHLDVSR